MPKRMSGTISVRLSSTSLKLLRARSRKQGQTMSEALRALIENQLAPTPEVSAHDLSAAWVGAIHSSDVAPGARVREALADWNPDRR